MQRYYRIIVRTDDRTHVVEASCLPWVPEKGTVGASGDLAPLAHLALGMMGEGKDVERRERMGRRQIT